MTKEEAERLAAEALEHIPSGIVVLYDREPVRGGKALRGKQNIMVSWKGMTTEENVAILGEAFAQVLALAAAEGGVNPLRALDRVEETVARKIQNYLEHSGGTHGRQEDTDPAADPRED